MLTFVNWHSVVMYTLWIKTRYISEVILVLFFYLKKGKDLQIMIDMIEYICHTLRINRSCIFRHVLSVISQSSVDEIYAAILLATCSQLRIEYAEYLFNISLGEYFIYDFHINFSNRDMSGNVWNRLSVLLSIWGSHQALWSLPHPNVTLKFLIQF